MVYSQMFQATLLHRKRTYASNNCAGMVYQVNRQVYFVRPLYITKPIQTVLFFVHLTRIQRLPLKLL